MDKLTKGWVQHQRKAARQEAASRGSQCLHCDAEVQSDFGAFKAHYTLKHPALAEEHYIEEAFKNFTLHGIDPIKAQSSAARLENAQITGVRARKRPVSGNLDFAEDEPDRLNLAGDETTSSCRGSKKICSPPVSITQQRGLSPSTPGRSRARPSERDDDFIRSENPTGRQLWIADDDRKGGLSQRPRTPQTRHGQLAPTASHHRSLQLRTHRSFTQPQVQSQPSFDNAPASGLFRQPETRPISSDQLAAEVQGIYAGLVLLESKCIEYDNSQKDAKLSEEQYHALISLHRSLLHEHHDFLLASQHPSASDALRRLASKYYMPARMWRHGVHSFLELLRGKLKQGSLEHMLTFIHIAYTMTALLYETVPAFEDTWIECLGDLGRYRMAVEDDDIRDREIWTGVSRDWYTKAADRAPITGRLYHHLGILARPNALQQLNFHAKSLCVAIPFLNARQSVSALFQPLLNPSSNTVQRLEPVNAAFVTELVAAEETFAQLEERHVILGQTVSDVASNVRHGPKEKFVLPITINGKIHHALADTMASRNVMSKKYAAAIGAAVDRSRGKQHTFMNAIGKTFRAIGETTLEVSFPDEPSKKIWQTFAVVKKCAAELVVSDTFLRMTETLTKFQSRREKIICTAKKLRRLCYMNAPHRQLICSINGESVFANADTGSDIDVVSLQYAKRCGWVIQELEPADRDVVLSDGSIVQLAGYVNASLTVGKGFEQNFFYVLDKLQCHVLLGDETLHRLDAFNQHEALFVDEDAVDRCPRFYAIKWRERVDDHVNQILDNKLPPGFLSALPDMKKRSVWRRMVDEVFGASPVEEISAWTVAFQRSLEIIETIETDSQNRANKQMELLAGDDLQIAKESDGRRKRQYQEQKNRILAQMQEFQRSWTAFDKHPETVPLDG